MENMLLRTGLACLGLVVVSCANFRNLGRELKMVGAGYTVVARLDGMAAERGPVRGVVVEWDRAAGRIVTCDVIDVGESTLKRELRRTHTPTASESRLQPIFPLRQDHAMGDTFSPANEWGIPFFGVRV